MKYKFTEFNLIDELAQAAMNFSSLKANIFAPAFPFGKNLQLPRDSHELEFMKILIISADQ